MKKAEDICKLLCFFCGLWFAWWLGVYPAPARAQETVHGYAETVEVGPQDVHFVGQVRLLQTALQAFAHEVQQTPQGLRLQGTTQDPVRLRSTHWELLAQQVYAENAPALLEATQATLHFDAPAFEIQSESVRANAHRWHFHKLEVMLPGIPGALQAEHAYYLPDAHTLWLQGVRYWGIPLPDVQWRFDTPETLRLRPDFWAIQPRLRWGSLEDLWQGFDVGALAELWRTENQRAYSGLYYGQATGWRSTAQWEWRPHLDTTWLVQGQWQEKGLASSLSAAIDYYQALHVSDLGLEQPVWAHVGVFTQQPDQFLQRLGLPLRLSPSLQSGVQATLTTGPETAFDGRLEHMAMLGLQGGTQQRVSALWRGDLQLGHWGLHAFSGSTQAHMLYTPELGLAPTVGVRLTDSLRWNAHWLTGLYAEQYVSTLPESLLWTGRLSPWLGGFVQWQGDQVAVAADAALDATTGTLRQWNLLSSWRYHSFFLHVGWFALAEPALPGGFLGGPRVSLQWVLP